MKKLAIILPGYLDSKDYAHLVDLDFRLQNLGYQTARINPAGVWGAAENISKYSISRCLRDVDDEIKKHGQSDEIILLGHSLGGMVAMLYAASHENIKTVVAIMSPSVYSRGENEEKVAKWQEEGFRTSVRDLPNEDGTKKFQVPFSFIEDAKKYDVAKSISNFRRSLLLIAGEKDDVVSFDQIQSAYENANEPKKLIIIEGIGHDYRHNQDEIKIVNDKIMDYIQNLEHAK